jgi:NitT/TauT family transport system permease protein
MSSQSKLAAPHAPTLHRRASGLFQSPVKTRLAVIAAGILIWEVGARVYDDAEFLPTASRTAIAVVELLQRPTIWSALGYMAAALLVGFAIAMVFGTVLGMIIGRNRTAYLTFFPIIVLLYTIPQVTLLPLFVLAFGIGTEVKIVYGLTHGFFPIIVCVIAGTQNINPVLITAAHSMGATRKQILQRIVFPFIIPSLFTGMRLGMSAVLIGVILAELYASQRGVGYYIRHYSETFESHNLFALVILVSVTGIVMNELLRRAEQHFSRWRS